MESLIPESSVILRWLIDYSIDISIIIVLIFVIRLLTKKLPAWWHYTLWLVLLLFMMVPLEFEKPANIPDVVPASIEENLFEFIFIEEEIVMPEFRQEASINPQGISSSQLNPEGRHIPLNYILLFIWLTSAISFILYVLVKNILFWNTIKREPLLTEAKVLNLMEECKIRMKTHTRLKIIITDKVKSPALFGCIRPRLLLPVGILEKIDETELSYIFMHELGHIKRHDVTMAWLTIFLQAVHWFNPLVWFSFHKMRIDQESACDNFVLSRIKPGQSMDYGNAIVGFLEKFRRNRKIPILAGILENKSQIKRRMNMIINYRKYSKIKIIFTSVFLVLICLVFFSITCFSKENKKPAGLDSPIIEVISLENQKDSIDSQAIDAEYKKEIENPVQKSQTVFVAAQDKTIEDKKETAEPAGITTKRTANEQDRNIEREAAPDKFDKKIKMASATTKKEADIVNNEEKLITIKVPKDQRVAEDKDVYRETGEKKLLDETQKDLTTFYNKDVTDKKEVIRLAGTAQKTPENKNMKNENDPEKFKPRAIRAALIYRPQSWYNKTPDFINVHGNKIQAKLSRQFDQAMNESGEYINEENYKGAIKVLLDYLAKKPETEKVFPPLYEILGYLWFYEGEMEEARKMFKEAYEIYPDEYLLEKYAFTSYKAGQFEDASQLYEKLYDTGKEKNVTTRLEYAAQSNIKLENWTEAKRLYKRMLALPRNPDQRWLKNIIALCKRLNQTEEAESYKKQLKELYGYPG